MLATYGGLLHDVGKIAYRSGGPRQNHSRRGFDFLRDCWSGSDGSELSAERKSVLDCVLYHHQEMLRDAAIPPDSLAWLIYEADNVSAEADRREDGNADEKRHDMYLPLKPIFTKLNGSHDGFELLPYATEKPGENRFLPVLENTRRLNMADYQDALSVIGRRVERLSLNERELNPLLLLLEDVTGAIPSSTSKSEVSDISLYDHAKTTAAIAACLSEYALENDIKDLKAAFYRKGKAFRDKPAFLLYSADISGIQKFIYTVSTKNALKSLRSRSFFLETAMEHYIDELLNGVGLSRANLLYSGGGHCYILLPNTARVIEIIKAWNLAFNNFLSDAFGIRLYLADGWTECTANDLVNQRGEASRTENGGKSRNAAEAEIAPYSAMFRRVSSAVARKKIQRYTPEQVLRMNAGGADHDGRECRICGRSDRLRQDRDGEDICHWCYLFEDLTVRLKEKTVYILERRKSESAMPLPLLDGGKAFLYLTSEADAKEALEKEPANILRLYVRDAPSMEEYCTARLNAGVYAARDTLDELARESVGIKRLGVCRMDVDNLGQAFVSGFEQPDADGEDKYRYVTLSRTSSFSRQMSLFFKRYVNALLDGSAGINADGQIKNQVKNQVKNNLPAPDGQVKNNFSARALQVALVYSGGDDVFLVGAWYDTIEAARRIQWALNAFTCGALTISAGVGIFTPHYPIRMAALRTADLEDFDTDAGYSYHWKEFREKVLGEKLKTLSEFFDNPANGRGNSQLYKILALLRESRNYDKQIKDKKDNSGESKSNGKPNDEVKPVKGIALARYAYLLARLSPGGDKNSPRYKAYEDFSRKMYDWGIHPTDRDELMMATQLYVYLNRGVDENNDGTEELYGV